MNEIQLNKTDSRFFKQNIIGWNVNDSMDIKVVISKEKEIVSAYNPAMITAFLPVGDVKSISHFSACNYQFIECRLLVEKDLNEVKSYNLYPYEFIEVTNRTQLNILKKIFRTLTFDDRFFHDPLVDRELALQRNIFFLEQSYKRKNEFIYILQNSFSKEVLGFRSFKLNSKTEASMLISGIVKEKQEENLQEFINLFELEKLYNLNIRSVKAVISAQNFDEINHYIAKYGYTIYDSKILFRKVLKPFNHFSNS